MLSISNYIIQNWSVILIIFSIIGWVGWFVDNVLAQVPSLKSNSCFQLLCNFIDALVLWTRRIKTSADLIDEFKNGPSK